VDLVPGGAPVAQVGSGRVVMALDPDVGGVSLAHAGCTLLLLHAQREAAQASTGSSLATVDLRLAEAEQHLALRADTLNAASGVRTGAAKVVAGV
jgi:hypothetical protein